MREKQREVFLEQLQQFPDVDSSEGPEVWENFRGKDEHVRELVSKLDSLGKLIDGVNKRVANT